MCSDTRPAACRRAVRAATGDPAVRRWLERTTLENIDGLFPDGCPLNLGVLNGEPSDGLIDVDLDTMEAVAARQFSSCARPAHRPSCRRRSMRRAN